MFQWNSLICIMVTLFVHPSNAKVGGGFYMENMDDAFFKMGMGRGLDVTKTEWKVERNILNNQAAKEHKDLKGTCTIRFIDSKNTGSLSKNIALFSTGEVGEWKVVSPQKGKPFTSCSYEDAVKSTLSALEIEVKSSSKNKGNSKSQGGGDDTSNKSSIVYHFPITGGALQPVAVLAKTAGSVKYYPNGRSLSSGFEEYELSSTTTGAGSGPTARSSATSSVDGGIDIASASMHVKAGKPLVDSQWAKGRRWFWTRREQGGMGNSVGYI